MKEEDEPLPERVYLGHPITSVPVPAPVAPVGDAEAAAIAATAVAAPAAAVQEPCGSGLDGQADDGDAARSHFDLSGFLREGSGGAAMGIGSVSCSASGSAHGGSFSSRHGDD